MKITVKIKHIFIVILAAVLLAYVVGGASAEGPSAYVRYYNSGGSVIASVYWDDTSAGGPFNVKWANDVTADGSSLNWSSDMTKHGSGADTYVTLTLTKYKNYYFKIYNGSNVTIVRSYPSDFSPLAGPRYQNDYAHGNFTPDTGMCASCHSAHTALKAQLLKQATYYELCLLCHGNSSIQSKYDVVTGKVYTAGGWKDSLAGPIGTGVGTITSKHNIDDTVNTKVYVPGSEQSDPARMLTFTCVSCHKSHGGRNDNYRLLKEIIYPSDSAWNPQTVSFRAYAIVKDPAVGEEVYLVSGSTEFCAACHLDYDEGNASTKGGVYKIVYRHPVTVESVVYSVYSTSPAKDYYPTAGDYLPLQYYGAGESKTADKRTAVVCETCHFAHGTYKTFAVYLPPEGTEVTNQKMLRLDNYGVCQSCHKK